MDKNGNVIWKEKVYKSPRNSCEIHWSNELFESSAIYLGKSQLAGKYTINILLEAYASAIGEHTCSGVDFTKWKGQDGYIHIDNIQLKLV